VIDKDRVNFAALMTGVHDIYGKAASAFALSVWWEVVLPYDFDAVKDTLNRHCINPDAGQFLPRPADVVKVLSGSMPSSGKMGGKRDR
jgi:hypothetical protein